MYQNFCDNYNLWKAKKNHTQIQTSTSYSLKIQAFNKAKCNQKFACNQLEKCSSSFISTEEVPNKVTTLRAAVGANSLSGSQGHVHCDCLTKCTTLRCKCLKLERKCNSRCHNGGSCNNK